jgi:hypothetical protein
MSVGTGMVITHKKELSKEKINWVNTPFIVKKWRTTHFSQKPHPWDKFDALHPEKILSFLARQSTQTTACQIIISSFRPFRPRYKGKWKDKKCDSLTLGGTDDKPNEQLISHQTAPTIQLWTNIWFIDSTSPTPDAQRISSFKIFLYMKQIIILFVFTFHCQNKQINKICF